MSYDLTGEKISFTYGRVVQIVSGSYYDGFGNVLPIGTSSVVISGSTSGFATTGSNTFIGNEIVSGSVIVTNGITGSLYGTSSYSLNTISSSYALTASYSNTSIYSNTSTSSSYALSASYAPIDTNITVSWSSNSSTASYVVTAQTASYYGGSVISSSYALTASFALNGGGSNILDWTGSNFVSNTTTQSIAAFNTSGYPMLVTPTSDNVYLAVQNGVMKWIPIASVAVTFLNVIFNQEINFEDGQYNTSIVPVQYISDFNQEIDVKDGQYNTSIVPVVQYISDFNQEINVKDGQYNTAIIPVQNISDFNQEINVKDGQYNTSIVPVVLFISSFSSGSI